MDIATILGIVSGIGLIILSIKMNSGLTLFWSPSSIMIVGGGTIAATLISYPLKEFLKVIGLFLRVFRSQSTDPNKLKEQLLEIAKVSREEGVLAIENRLTEINETFLASGLRMVVDGVAPQEIVKRMRNEMSIQLQQHKVGWEIFSAMGSYSPAFGMVGTLIGLVQMLASLDEPDTIGPKMAVALITTFYGTILANLVFLPMSAKLKRRSAEETRNMNLILEGIQSIRSGESTMIMEEKLDVYLRGQKKKEKGEEEE